MSHRLFSLEGKLALVTGSTRGLGNAFARGLAEAGAEVVVHGRDPKVARRSAEEIAEEFECRTHSLSFDICDSSEVKQSLEAFFDSVGAPDILVNNAGTQSRSSIEDFGLDEWDSIVQSNLSSVFYVSKPILKKMSAAGRGKVVNIGSVTSLLARETVAPYGATKGAVAMLTKGMSADLAHRGIQVNTISPGYFATEMNSALIADESFDTWIKNRTPAGRWGLPEELVGTLVYLCSDASNFVSGQNIFVDGGMTSVV